MCSSKPQVYYLLKEIVDSSGEGIVMRKRGSAYEHGRTESMLKFKVRRITKYLNETHRYFERKRNKKWGCSSIGRVFRLHR